MGTSSRCVNKEQPEEFALYYCYTSEKVVARVYELVLRTYSLRFILVVTDLVAT